MKRNEAGLWIDYHRAVFPDWSEWYQRVGSDDPAISKAGRKILFDSYAKALARVDLDDATAATDAMLAGDCPKPFLAEDHLARIIARAAKLYEQHRPRARYSDGQRTFNCPSCEDRGLVLVATDRTCSLGGREIPVRSEAKACSCELGNAHARAGILRFDPQTEAAIT